VLISSSEDESSDRMHKDVNIITVSSDEMCNDHDDDGGYSGKSDDDGIDIVAPGEASETPANNIVDLSESELAATTSGSHDSEPAVRDTELQSTTVHTQQCSEQSSVDHSQLHDNHDGEVGKLKLQEMFNDKLSLEQIASVYKISGEDFTTSMECLLSGPTLKSILLIMNRHHAEQPMMKLDIDHAEAWEDTIAFYKSSRLDFSKQI